MIEIIHSPVLEHLAAELMRELQRLRRRDARRIFEPLTVVVPHLGMARWLEQQIAQHFGICANIRFIFPGEWVQLLTQQFLPEGNSSQPESADRYQVGAMTWVLYQALDSQLGPEELPVSERYKLALRYARLFADYQIYRRDWLSEFARLRVGGAFSALDERARQALLWQALQAVLGTQDRSQRYDALQRAIVANEAPAQAFNADALSANQSVLFFGMAQLAPDLLALLRSVAQQQSVQLYFPNPCLEYWADVVRERFLERRALSDDLLEPERAASAFDHFEVGHPLLGSLGAQGQGFFAELAHASDQFVEASNSESNTNSPSLLHALQLGIQQLQPDYLPSDLQADASVQVLQCASRLDELYLVKAKIIAALNANPSLRLDQIAVLAPNLENYAPLVPSVFAPESASGRAGALRFSLLDTHTSASGPGAGILAVLQLLLQLDQKRFSGSELMQLLRLEPVAAQFDLDPFDLDRVEALLEQARFAFALDAQHRAQLIALDGESLTQQLGANEQASLHTWLAALERLVLGYLHGSDQSEQFASAAPAPIWPVPDVGAGQARLLAVMAQLLRQLRLALREVRRKRTVLEWCSWFERQVLGLAGRACADVEQYAPFKALLEQLSTDAQGAELLERVEYAAVREALRTLMQQSARQAHPSLGAICIASLIPMRALPFRWVFVLGLNEGEFPQAQPPDNLNLMQAPGARRVGDRNRGIEDRYLFLEALMASRDALVLSYQAQVADGSTRAPASVLSELLRQMQRQFGARFPQQPWLQDNRNVTLLPTASAAQPSSSVLTEPRLTASKRVDEITPRALLNFWKNPLKHTLQQAYGLAVARQNDDADYLEPLSLDADKIERIEWRLLRQARQTGIFPERAPNWLGRSGLLPSGALGVQAWENVRTRTLPIWQRFADEFAPLCALPLAPLWVDLRLNHAVIRGWVSDCLVQARCLVHLAPNPAHGGQWLELLLRTAILQASDPEPWRVITISESGSKEYSLFEPDSARAYLDRLLALQAQVLSAASQPQRARAELPWFWPRLSFAAARSGKWTKPYPPTAKNFELLQSGFFQLYADEAEFQADTAAQTHFFELAACVFALQNSAHSASSAVSFEQLGFDSEVDSQLDSSFGGADDY